MAEILVLGAGVNGLCAALLLARDGHPVTVLERDPAAPPEPVDAWEAWERRGCAQFRLPHYLLPRFRHELAAVLPDVEQALVAAGAVTYDVVDALPPRATGGRRDGDDRYTALTARRPVLEAVVAARAAAEPGLVVRRGTTARSLLAGAVGRAGRAARRGRRHGGGRGAAGRPRGRRHRAEVAGGRVADRAGRRPGAGGARSGRVRLLRPPLPGRAMPPLQGPVHQQHDSLSVLTLPADNGTWAVALCVSARDRVLRGLRDPAALDGDGPRVPPRRPLGGR
jgi:hypothetical protein